MPIIQTINLTKRYQDLVALDNLNLEIEQGDCFGFIGPNGAGKTTTIKILATLLRPTWGEARIDGLSVGPIHARQVRAIIGYVPDYFGSYPDMTAREYLDFFAAAYDIHGKQRQAIIDDVLSLTDLTGKADAPVNGLSRGMQQRLSLARVLLHDPRVLLLDEPASGLDPRARIEIRELLRELHRMGKTILISSHILLELADFCTRVGVIEQGRMVYTGTVQEMLQRARVGRAVLVAVADRQADAIALIKPLPGVVDVQPDGPAGQSLRVTLEPSRGSAAQIAHALVLAGLSLTRLEEETLNLETAFMRLTQGLVQ